MKEAGKKMRMRDWVQTIVSIGALGVAFTSLIISCNINNITAEEKQNEFVSTMNITKKTVMNVFFFSMLYENFSLLKYDSESRKTNSITPIRFQDIEFLSSMIMSKDNVLKRSEEVYTLYVLIKDLEAKVKWFNREMDMALGMKKEKLLIFEKNVFVPNIKMINEDCRRLLKKIKEIEKAEEIILISDNIVCPIDENQRSYLNENSKFYPDSGSYKLDLEKEIEEYAKP